MPSENISCPSRRDFIALGGIFCLPRKLIVLQGRIFLPSEGFIALRGIFCLRRDFLSLEERFDVT